LQANGFNLHRFNIDIFEIATKRLRNMIFLRSIIISVFLLFHLFVDAQTNTNKTLPIFKGGEEAMRQFLATNIVYPIRARDNCKLGIVVVEFTVTTSGNVDSIEVIHSIDKDLDAEAIRVAKLSSGKWTPYMRNDTAFNTRLTLPVKFTIKNAGCKDNDYYYNEGVEFSKEQKYDEAFLSFTKAIKLNPYDMDAHYNCAVVKIKTKDFETACIYLNKIRQSGSKLGADLIEKYCK
jgi:TonB family protein